MQKKHAAGSLLHTLWLVGCNVDWFLAPPRLNVNWRWFGMPVALLSILAACIMQVPNAVSGDPPSWSTVAVWCLTLVAAGVAADHLLRSSLAFDEYLIYMRERMTDTSGAAIQ